MTGKNRTCKVHREFYDWLKEIADRNGDTMVSVTRDIARHQRGDLSEFAEIRPKRIKIPKMRI